MILRHLYFIYGGVFLHEYVLTVITEPSFFLNQQLKCNCEGNLPCDESGTCPSNKCERPYIGVTCQHVDIELVREKTHLPEYPKLHDGDDSTCADPLSFKGKVTYTIKDFVLYFWVYISRSKKEDMKPNLILRNDSAVVKTTPYYFKVSETSILIKIAERVTYDVLELTNLPSDTCSVDISLGRNLAPTANATQISTKYYLFSAQNAINVRESNCAYTKGDTAAEWWKARLKYDARINLVHVIYAKWTACNNAVMNLKTITSTGEEAFNKEYTYTKDTTNGNILIVGDERVVREVVVTKVPQKTMKCAETEYQPIYVCEFVILGEFQCPDHQYGALCEISCPGGCGRDLCDPDWGCLGGCNDGWALEGPWCLLVFMATIVPTGPLTELSGTDKILTCTKNDEHVPGAPSKTTFYKDGAEVKVKDGAEVKVKVKDGKSKNTLKLTSTTLLDSGSYSCRLEVNGFVTVESSRVEINFIDKPVLTIVLTRSYYEVMVNMYCVSAADTRVELTYTFKKGGAVIKQAAGLPSSTFSVLALDLDSKTLAGNYSCEVHARGRTFVSDDMEFVHDYNISTEICMFKYGPLCQFYCSNQCGGLGDCDSRTAACLQGCKPGFLPPRCERHCPVGAYGTNCSQVCTYCPANVTSHEHLCEHTVGRCVKTCGHGLYGKYCEKLSVFSNLFDLKKLVSILLVILAGLALLYWKYRFFTDFANTYSKVATSNKVDEAWPGEDDDDEDEDRTFLEDTDDDVSGVEYVLETSVDPNSTVVDPVKGTRDRKVESQV